MTLCIDACEPTISKIMSVPHWSVACRCVLDRSYRFIMLLFLRYIWKEVSSSCRILRYLAFLIAGTCIQCLSLF